MVVVVAVVVVVVVVVMVVVHAMECFLTLSESDGLFGFRGDKT